MPPTLKLVRTFVYNQKRVTCTEVSMRVHVRACKSKVPSVLVRVRGCMCTPGARPATRRLRQWQQAS
eukprot:860042-Pleurochrysis_carterae.AAC.2